MNVFIIGGTSGLGLEIGKLFLEKGAQVYATGRKELNITENLDQLIEDLNEKVSSLPTIDLFIYAAGFLEKGHIGELSDAHIAQMINVGLTAPALILERLLKKQKHLEGFIAITSTSQWIPRELEPVYTGVKAGLAMLAQSVSFDPNIKKTLVVGPAGMNTEFWTNSDRDVSALLSPKWVAEQILKLWVDNYIYRLTRILRDPTPEAERVQIIETRFE
ncbi:MAG: SDR family oxidoreductase [bacterium]|nr:SDR family oxidoreductase [bacterium]